MTSRAREHEQFRWTPETIDEAAALWNDGGYSAEEIGRRLGVSRNAVIGLAHRKRALFRAKTTAPLTRRERPRRKPAANTNVSVAPALIAPNWNSSMFRKKVQAQPVTSASVGEMVEAWITRNGEPRRFPRGFSGDWLAIRNKMHDLGWDLKMSGSWYSMLPLGSRAKQERLTRDAILAKIDGVLIANGMTPFLRREMKEAAE